MTALPASLGIWKKTGLGCVYGCDNTLLRYINNNTYERFAATVYDCVEGTLCVESKRGQYTQYI
jgi:hypothetical protein